LKANKKVGIGINKRVDLLRTMTLNDNKIDYIHWYDPNDIVDLRFEASRQASHNGQRNSIDYRKASWSRSDYKLTSFYTHRSVDNADQQVWTITWKRIALSVAWIAEITR